MHLAGQNITNLFAAAEQKLMALQKHADKHLGISLLAYQSLYHKICQTQIKQLQYNKKHKQIKL